MVKSSLIFLLIAIGCLLAADISITTLDPWLETGRMVQGAITPHLTDTTIPEFISAFANTLALALLGIFVSIVLGSFLAIWFHKTPVRLFCAAIRAVHELFWAFILMPLVGLNPTCGILAIAIPYTGIFAKVYAEILQETDKSPLDGLPANISVFSRFLYGIFPLIRGEVIHYTSYRFECALRSSTVLGFIGLPTLGFYLETAFREGLYSEAFFILGIFYLLIFSLKYWLKPVLVAPYTLLALFFISKNVQFSLDNVIRFFHEIIPWPIRRAGFFDGTNRLDFDAHGLLEWILSISKNEAIPGVINTVLLTQIALVGAGIFALVFFPALCKWFLNPVLRKGFNLLMIIIRTTPEYILAYIFILLWGPSMLPAIVAIALHNGAISAHLLSNDANNVNLERDDPEKPLNRYFYSILPRVYGQFLAFLFYRWEIMMRESSILGILGIFTLGFFVDSAIAVDKLDKALFLIIVTAILNIGIDTISQRIRSKGWINQKQINSKQSQ